MSPNIHTTIRGIAMAASVIMVPNAALLCHTLSIQVSRGYARWEYGHPPLPAITQFWIIEQSQSSMLIIVAFVVAAALALTAFNISRFPETNPWKATSQILVTILGSIVALLMIVSTIMAALLPAIVVFQADTK